ncbi:dTDP-4-dehydrorhamnose reductase [Aliiroseovarius sp. KMU-50]|uniref:dTDP-4-dehydrorhamnose reductase n=1 Tax=Aliiroseovarius salicola TaxID=3009082 RepID=A0ABT4VZX2_9RHOB|nr:dTDP-4-dehydrorhamnose reductase [Aliiroseovarius sp. KMU-50]MDA5093078.1 dTDP-4-dehydrorhamnose reductase [Aliiroseovarius sp. KMU-50]
MILVFGKTGQVAREIATYLPDAICLEREQADLSIPGACRAAIQSTKPSAVINAAAFTAVDRAEEEDDLAHQVNGAAPVEMAEACKDLGIPLIQISTDYVFDGRGHTPFTPNSPTQPLGVYGQSKLAAEVGIRETGATHVILRTSWVFSCHGNNFAKTMLRLSKTRDHLNVVADQIGGPTPASAIAEACVKIADQLITAPEKSGTYHFTGAPDVSWADFARAIFSSADKTVAVNDIPSSEFPTPAKRPLSSRLDCSRTQQVFGINRPDWQQALVGMIADLKGSAT